MMVGEEEDHRETIIYLLVSGNGETWMVGTSMITVAFGNDYS